MPSLYSNFASPTTFCVN